MLCPGSNKYSQKNMVPRHGLWSTCECARNNEKKLEIKQQTQSQSSSIRHIQEERTAWLFMSVQKVCTACIDHANRHVIDHYKLFKISNCDCSQALASNILRFFFLVFHDWRFYLYVHCTIMYSIEKETLSFGETRLESLKRANSHLVHIRP